MFNITQGFLRALALVAIFAVPLLPLQRAMAGFTLFNFVGGANLSGGPTLDLNNGGGSPSNSSYLSRGIFLDPNGMVNVTNSNVLGRVFGGDSHDFQFISGSNIAAPGTVPDGGSAVALLGIALVGIEGARRLIHARAGERRNGVKSKGYVAQSGSSVGSEMNSLDESPLDESP
jgi:hypothetical protein